MNKYKSVTDDILKPKRKAAKIKAEEIWNDFCNKKIPVRLNDVIQKMGIEIKEEDLSIDGYTKMNNYGVYCILYSKNASRVRQRFTVAHEIGHIVLEHVSILENCNQYSKQSQEKEANTFAGELLIPSSDIKKFVKENTPTIQDIVNRYLVSKDVVFIAIQNNKLLNKIKI